MHTDLFEDVEEFNESGYCVKYKQYNNINFLQIWSSQHYPRQFCVRGFEINWQ